MILFTLIALLLFLVNPKDNTMKITCVILYPSKASKITYYRPTPVLKFCINVHKIVEQSIFLRYCIKILINFFQHRTRTLQNT